MNMEIVKCMHEYEWHCETCLKDETNDNWQIVLSSLKKIQK